MRARAAGPLLLMLMLAVATPAPAPAQTSRTAAPNQRIREPYITRSGATVAKPGEPQGSAPTPLDRTIRKQDNAIDGSLCKGC